MICRHVTARCARWETPLSSAPVAPLLWRALRTAFPHALGCVLMPNHFHLLAVEPSPEHALVKVRAVLSGARRSAIGSTLRWEPAPLPVAVPDASHLRRQLRYLALNPCRAGLVRDPLMRLWSTHRDVIGAVVNPWVRAEELARLLKVQAVGFAGRHHAYVSADPAVDVEGTPFPAPAVPVPGDLLPLGQLLAAAAAATRASPEELCRRSPARTAFMDLARAFGWRDAELVGNACGATACAVRLRARHGSSPPPAALLCLGDERLLRGEASPLNSREAGAQAR